MGCRSVFVCGIWIVEHQGQINPGPGLAGEGSLHLDMLETLPGLVRGSVDVSGGTGSRIDFEIRPVPGASGISVLTATRLVVDCDQQETGCDRLTAVLRGEDIRVDFQAFSHRTPAGLVLARDAAPEG